MNPIENYSPGRKSGKRFIKAIHIDMTPMVDLGFLLITFFIFTTTLNTPVTMSLGMPKNGPPTAVPVSKAMTLILHGNNQVYAYEGDWQSAISQGAVNTSSWEIHSGVGDLVRNKQQKLFRKGGAGAKDELTLLIKPTDKASYRNIIDALDEAVINGVKYYAILPPSAEELVFVKDK